MEIMVVILHPHLDPQVVMIKTPRWAGVAVVQMRVMEMNSHLSPIVQTPTFRISE
jgi:hypothetical protein